MSTEEQKIAELLKPRYKVIADYPGSPFKVNDVLNERNGEDKFYNWIHMMESYPHLFRKISWWEDREEKDMPEYLSRMIHGRKVVKKLSGKNFLDDDYMEWQFGGYNRNDFLPATKLEFTTYQSSIKQ